METKKKLKINTSQGEFIFDVIREKILSNFKYRYDNVVVTYSLKHSDIVCDLLFNDAYIDEKDNEISIISKKDGRYIELFSVMSFLNDDESTLYGVAKKYNGFVLYHDNSQLLFDNIDDLSEERIIENEFCFITVY